MTLEYSLLAQFKNQEVFLGTDENLNITRIADEVRQLTRNICALSTRNETEALPELYLINDITQTLLEVSRTEIQSFFIQHQALEKLFFEDLLEVVCAEIFRGKNYNSMEIVKTSDSILSNLVSFCTQQIELERKVHLQILACILDKNLEFYKYNGNEKIVEAAPFGIYSESSLAKISFLQSLTKNDLFDCVKRQSDVKIWSVAVFDRIEGYTVHFRFLNESTNMSESLKSISAAKFGTKSVDYEWRNTLRKGSVVDYYQFRHGWSLYTVTETYVETNIFRESVKSVDLERFQIYMKDKTNQFDDTHKNVASSLQNNRFNDNLSKVSRIKVNSALIALKGKYSSKKDHHVDDSEDFYWISIVDGWKFAILRPKFENGPSSIYFVKYVNLFGEKGGFNYIMKIISGTQGCSLDALITIFRIINASSETFLERFIAENGQLILKWISDFLEQTFVENIRSFTNPQLTIISEALKSFSQRVMSTVDAANYSNNAKAKIAIFGLKSDFLEKQFLGAKFIQEIYDDLTRINDFTFLDRLASDLGRENIFEKIIKGHSSLIERGAGVLLVMLFDKKIDENMMNLLITQIFKTDSESRTSLIDLVHNIIANLSIQQIREFAKLIFNRPDEITLEITKLCITLQRASLDKFNDTRLSCFINDSLWNLLERDAGSTKLEIVKEIQTHLINLTSTDTIEEYLQQILKRIANNANKAQHFHFLLKIIKKKQILSQQISAILKKSKIVKQCIQDLTKQIENEVHNVGDTRYPLENNNGKIADRQFPKEDHQEAEQKNLNRILKFLSILIHENSFKEHDLFGFRDFCDVFASVFTHNPKIKVLEEWIMKYVSTICNVFHLTEYKVFLEKYLSRVLDDSHADFIRYFIQIFLNVNILENKISNKMITLVSSSAPYKSTIKNVRACMINANHFFGMGLIKSQFIQSESSKLFHLIGNFISNIYLPYEPYDGDNFDIYSKQKDILTEWALQLFKSEDLMQAEKGTIILLKIIQSEESKINSEMYSISQLREADKVFLNIERIGRNGNYGRSSIRVHGNFTLNSLKSVVAETYKIKIDTFDLLNSNGVDYKPGQYILTIDALKIESGSILYLKETDFPEVKEENIYDNYKLDLTQPAKEVLEEIYNSFAQNGKLTYDRLREFFSRITNRKYSDQDQIIQDLCLKMDRLKLGFVALKNFIEFFRDACQNKPNGIANFRQNLQTLGYKKNLKLKNVRRFIDENDFATFTRSKIANDSKCFDLLIRYITQSKAQKESSMSIESDTEQGLSNLHFFEKLFGLLPPSIESILNVLFEPTETIAKTNDHFMLEYYLTLVNSLMFRPEFWKSLDGFALPLESESYDTFKSRIFSFDFFSVLTEKLRNLMLSRNLDIIYAHGPSGFSLLLKIMKVLVGVETPDFIENMHQILTFFSDYKRKNAERLIKSGQHEEETGRHDLRSHSNPSQISTQSKKINDLILDFTINRDHEELTAKIDFELLNELILSLLETINSKKLTYSSSENLLLSSGVILLIGSAHLQKEVIRELVASINFKNVMLAGLTNSCQIVRHYYKNMYAYLNSLFTDIKSKTEFLSTILSCVGSKNQESFRYVTDLALELLSEVGQMKLQDEAIASFIHREFNFNELFLNFSKCLFEHVSAEELFNQTEDQSLICYLSFLDKIIRTDEIVSAELTALHRQQIIDFLSDKCLFGISHNKMDLSLASCKSSKSRYQAYELLKNLLKNDSISSIVFIQSKLSLLIQNIPSFGYNQNLDSADIGSSSQGDYLGIKNLGAVCYMIATLQQFFTTSTFTNGILSACDGRTPDITNIKGHSFDDNIFHQFQNLLGNLKFSKRQEFNPIDFCLSYKDFRGDPVNVSVQQDADEFLKVFLEKIENALRNSAYAGLLNSIYGGKICNLIICKSCGHKTTNDESFYNISLEVKKMTNIKESLDKLIEEEIISDYTCERCKKKSDISKRALLKKLPNVLILSLKKTYFDLELLTNVKVHNRYEFPMRMDLRKYTYCGLSESTQKGFDGKASDRHDYANKVSTTNHSDDSFEYKLVGVVIHRGNADYGHYTSIINTNRDDPTCNLNNNDTWYEFDDARVFPYNMRNFEDDCFGVDESKGPGSMKIEVSTSKSAYLLVYEKIKKDDLIFPIGLSNQVSKEHLIHNLINETDYKFENGDFRTPYYNLKCKIPYALRTQIEKDNQILLFEELLINSHFLTFCSEIFGNLELCLQANTEAPGIPNILDEQTVLLKKIEGSIAIVQHLPVILSKISVYANRCNKIVRSTSLIIDSLEFLHECAGSSLVSNQQFCFEEIALKFYKESIFDNFKAYIQIIYMSGSEELRKGLSFFLWKSLKFAFTCFKIDSLDNFPVLEDQKLPKLVVCSSLQTNLQYIISNLLVVDTKTHDLRKLDVFFNIIYQIASNNNPALKYLADMDILMPIYQIYMSVDQRNVSDKTLNTILGIIEVLIGYEESSYNSQYQQHLTIISKMDIIDFALNDDYSGDNYEMLQNVISIFSTNDFEFSRTLANELIKSIWTYRDAPVLSFFKGIFALIDIQDHYSSQRLQLILGISRLKVKSEPGIYNYIFGLGPELSLKEQVTNYVSTFFCLNSILEIIYCCKDDNLLMTTLFINELVNSMNNHRNVLDYMIKIEPPNYIYSSYFCWFAAYRTFIMNHSNIIHAISKITRCQDFFDTFDERLQLLEMKLNHLFNKPNGTSHIDLSFFAEEYFTDNQNKKSWNTPTNQIDRKPLTLMRPIYIIGKIIDTKEIANKLLASDDVGEFRVICSVYKVSLAKSRPTGASNLVFPFDSITQDLEVKRSCIKDAYLVDFLPDLKDSTCVNDLDEVEFLDLSEQTPSKKDSFMDEEYILALESINTTPSTYITKFRFSDLGNQDDHREIIFPSLPNPEKQLIATRTERDLLHKVESLLSVEVAYKVSESANPKFFNETGFSQYQQILRNK